MSNAQNPAVAADLVGADPAKAKKARTGTGRPRVRKVDGMSRGQNILRYVVLFAGALVFLFNSNGLVNQILGPLAPDPTWLINPLLAMPTIAIFVTWKQMGFFILLYLAALQNVSDDLYEAAATDGAGKIRMFFSITVPGVRPATVLVLLLATVTGANLFTEPYLLTGGGGPNGASSSPVLIMYQRGIEQGEPGIAAAIGVILVIGVLILAFAQRKRAGGDES